MANDILKTPLDEITLIGFDTETTGKYPLQAEVCELAAVKMVNGKKQDEFQTLIRPRKPIPQNVIKIHGITNEMVKDAPVMEDVIEDFHKFLQGGILVAHHAPFDLGFIAPSLDQAGLDLPDLPVLCSSLLSRKAIPDSPNHRLQTLIPHLNLHRGPAHRALDDAIACAELTWKCFERAEMKVLEEATTLQGGPLFWSQYSLSPLKEQKHLSALFEALTEHQKVKITYGGGSKAGKPREVKPVGVVRNPNGDFLVAYDGGAYPKRYYLEKISDSAL